MPFLQKRILQKRTLRILPKRPTPKRVVEQAEHHPRQYRRLIAGGLAAFSGVCVVQMLGLSSLDLVLKVSLGCFALATPLLVRELVDLQAEERHEITVDRDSRLNATSTGLTFPLVGVSGLFFHFALWAGLLFTASCFWGLWSHMRYLTALSEEAKRLEKENQSEESKHRD